MRIYFDACCLNRLTDDQSQSRIREEAGAVERVLKLVRDGIIQWIASDALSDEIDKNPNLKGKLETRHYWLSHRKSSKKMMTLRTARRRSTASVTACSMQCIWLAPKRHRSKRW